MVRVKPSVLFLGLTAVSAYHPAVPASRIALRRSTDHEVTLGELIFSSRDPRLDVATTPELYGDDFCAFVEGKADDSEDMEERVALKSLVEMVRDTHKAIENARKDAEEIERRMMAAANGEDEDAPAAAASDASVDVLAAARAATLGDVYEGGDAGPAIDVGPTEAGLSGEALRTYALLTPLAGGDDAEALAAVIDAVNGLAAKRLEQAAARLGSVLKAGDPSKMMAKITELAVSGGVDTQLVELLEANRQQAAAAGPAGAQAAELMKNLASRCRDEMDKRETGPEIRLLRALLRSDDEDTRKQLSPKAVEMAAEAQGENVPWSDDRYDDMLPEGWDHAGPGGQIKKSIGGG
ncbi:hypothetical protein JL721_7772 [Aureococcus anophagefferens]|nr:hypothetical protein JL721_7772 [Aureococcus anophagefferens]